MLKAFYERHRNDEEFNTFYAKIIAEAEEETDPPALPRFKKPPKKLDEGPSPHAFVSPAEHFR